MYLKITSGSCQGFLLLMTGCSQGLQRGKGTVLQPVESTLLFN